MNLLKEVDNVKIGQLGNMGVYVSTQPHVAWGRGGVAVFVGTVRIKIFSVRYNWVIDPYYKEQMSILTNRNDEHYMNLHKKEVSYMTNQDHINDPMDAYLFMGNLLLSGYKPKTRSWASYFINEVGRLLKKEENYTKLLQ